MLITNLQVNLANHYSVREKKALQIQWVSTFINGERNTTTGQPKASRGNRKALRGNSGLSKGGIGFTKVGWGEDGSQGTQKEVKRIEREKTNNVNT